MRYETNIITGEVTEHEDAPIGAQPAPDLKAEARYYLASTDWYVTRYVETQVPIPTDILIKRGEARLVI